MIGGLPFLMVAVAARAAVRRHRAALGMSVVLSMAYAAVAERGAARLRLWYASVQHTTGRQWQGTAWEEWLSLVEIAAGLSMLTAALDDWRRRPPPARD